MALLKANPSPIAVCTKDLWGKDPRFLSLSPERSTLEMRTTPVREARTPTSLL